MIFRKWIAGYVFIAVLQAIPLLRGF
jgi:hypothetical protein